MVHTADLAVCSSNSGVAFLLFLSAESLLQYLGSSRPFCMGLFQVIGMCTSCTDLRWITRSCKGGGSAQKSCSKLKFIIKNLCLIAGKKTNQTTTNNNKTSSRTILTLVTWIPNGDFGGFWGVWNWLVFRKICKLHVLALVYLEFRSKGLF